MNNSNIDDFDMTKYKCTRRYKHLKTTIEHFWNQFSQECMNNLHEHEIFNRKKYMVIIKDDGKLPRLRWKKGVRQELITG